MKLIIYHLYKNFDYSNFAYPIALDVLKIWAKSIDWDVRVIVCKEENINFTNNAEVIAFSVYTQTAPICYRVAKKMPQEKIIIFGGPHFRGLDYQEGLRYCDILVHSVCQEQWQNILNDIKAGKIKANSKKRIYIKDTENKFCYPENFYETFKSQSWWQIQSVPTSLGCPYNCSFCNAYMSGKYLVRNIRTVYNELAHTSRWKPVFIADATFALNKNYTIELMETIAPLKRNLIVQSTLRRLQDNNILKALAKGGVKLISIGIESLNIRLNKLGQGSIKENLINFISNAHGNGMLVQGNFICGLDTDDNKSFEELYDFYKNSPLDLILIDILTPYPNTKLYDDLKKENRIIDNNFENYDYRHVVYKSKLMTKDQLINGFNKLYQKLFSYKTVYKKLKKVYSVTGPNKWFIYLIFFNIWGIFDAHRKKRAFKKQKNS